MRRDFRDPWFTMAEKNIDTYRDKLGDPALGRKASCDTMEPVMTDRNLYRGQD